MDYSTIQKTTKFFTLPYENSLYVRSDAWCPCKRISLLVVGFGDVERQWERNISEGQRPYLNVFFQMLYYVRKGQVIL